MKQDPKIVLDTNVWVSALIWGGKPAKIIIAAEDGKFQIFISEEMVVELSCVLAYTKLAKIYKAVGLRSDQLIETVLKTVKLVKATKEVKVVFEHPADDRVIRCALAAKADYIVSGDRHLLDLRSHGGTRILSVNEFLRVIGLKI